VSSLTGVPYDEVWVVDFEFTARLGQKPTPICVVASEVRAGRTLRLSGDEMLRLAAAPYRTDDGVLFVSYYAPAEIGCHLALDWPTPCNVLDLFAEFRCLTNGQQPPMGNGLLGALHWFGLPAIDGAHKQEMRELAMRGGPYASAEAQALLDYCATDVEALGRLLPVMLPHIDLERALLRGRYMVAAARIESVGVPLDVGQLHQLTHAWPQIQRALIADVDSAYHVFDGTVFSLTRWEQWLGQHGILWPRTETGRLALDDDVFRDMALIHPAVAPIQQLRATLGKMRLTGLSVGPDDRNRYMLSAFRAKTGRNQPSNRQSIFGPAVWMRGLIRPTPGTAIAYVDWSQQEFGIAAALSGDTAMLEAYTSGDSYLAFARQARIAPDGATKQSHRREREMCKQCVLATQYGMGAESLGRRLGMSSAHARELLDLHRRTYARFWRWSDGVVDYASQYARLFTVFGWNLHVGGLFREPSLRNFPMQANGAEMLRLACCYTTESGIRVCAPIHDAVLIEGPADSINGVVADVQDAMGQASADVLDGFRLRSDAQIVRHPDHYMDERGAAMWETVWAIFARLKAATPSLVVCADATTM
jgi:DNA polymerase I